jgi:hypothetical protein
MKQIYLGALRARMLYGGLVVLLTCLLIVGGAYHLKDAELQRLHQENARLHKDVSIAEARFADLSKDSRKDAYRLAIYELTYPEPKDLREERQRNGEYMVTGYARQRKK